MENIWSGRSGTSERPSGVSGRPSGVNGCPSGVSGRPGGVNGCPSVVSGHPAPRACKAPIGLKVWHDDDDDDDQSSGTAAVTEAVVQRHPVRPSLTNLIPSTHTYACVMQHLF